MKKAEFQSRMFPVGIIAAVCIALTSLGACDAGLGKDAGFGKVTGLGKGTDDAADQDAVDDAGLATVEFVLPKAAQQGATDARSLTSSTQEANGEWKADGGEVWKAFNFFELILKRRDATVSEPYTTGRTEGSLSVTVRVKGDAYYDILLLVGYETRDKTSHVLLFASFLNDRDGEDGKTGKTIYTPGADGVYIIPGEENTISVKAHYTNLTPDKIDGNEPDILAENAMFTRDSNKRATFTVNNESLKNNEPLRIKLSTTKLADLFNAQGLDTTLTSENKNPFASNTAIITPLNSATPEFKITSESESTSFRVAEDGSCYIYDFESATDTFLTTPGEYKLSLNLGYFAFGVEESGSVLWNIRNGINVARVDTGYDSNDAANSGSMIAVVVPSEPEPEPEPEPEEPPTTDTGVGAGVTW
jgi:hypothetical protein